MTTRGKRTLYRCRLCGAVLPAWIPVFEEPNGAMLLHHLSQRHPDRVGAYLGRIRHGEDITPMVLEAFEVVEEDQRP
jgi:hypothetical protein